MHRRKFVLAFNYGHFIIICNKLSFPCFKSTILNTLSFSSINSNKQYITLRFASNKMKIQFCPTKYILTYMYLFRFYSKIWNPRWLSEHILKSINLFIMYTLLNLLSISDLNAPLYFFKYSFTSLSRLFQLI